MTTVERVGEALTRRLDRRQTVRRSAAGVFGLVAAWAAQGLHAPGALAVQCSNITFGDCSCNPPNGRYCKSLDRSYCRGSQCSGGCTYDDVVYGNACWCTSRCTYGGGSRRGRYLCCDCNCNGRQCACRKFHPE